MPDSQTVGKSAAASECTRVPLCRALKFHGSSFLVASSRRFRQRATRKSSVSDEDATRMLATCPRNKSCVSGSWTSQNDTTHGQTGSTTPQQTAGAACQAGRGSRHARLVADILARTSRGCYAENGPVEFQLYCCNAGRTDRQTDSR